LLLSLVILSSSPLLLCLNKYTIPRPRKNRLLNLDSTSPESDFPFTFPISQSRGKTLQSWQSVGIRQGQKCWSVRSWFYRETSRRSCETEITPAERSLLLDNTSFFQGCSSYNDDTLLRSSLS
jgi:hypothetical protein